MRHPVRDTPTDWPLWWFAQLQAALGRGDTRAAANALRRLDRLGVEVRFRLPPRAPAATGGADEPPAPREGPTDG